MFRSCPIAISRPLPFAVNDMDFLRWLKSLTLDDDAKGCEQLLHILLTLNKTPIAGKTKLFILDKLTPVLFQLTARITSQPAVNQNLHPFEDENTVFEFSIWGCAELANGYKLLSLEESFKKNTYYSQQQKSLVITHGIQALGRALLYTSQLYSQPYAAFWSDCFHFYRLAHHNETINYNGDVIANAFKHVLVFYLSHSNQFSPQEMRVVHTLLGQYGVYAKLLRNVPEKRFRGIPYIHLRRDIPPSILDEAIDKDDPYILHVATAEVASKVLDAAYDKELKHPYTDQLMLLRLAKTLTSNSGRKHERMKVNDPCLAVTNFDHLVDYLRKQELENSYAANVKGYVDFKGTGALHKISASLGSSFGRKSINTGENSATWSSGAQNAADTRVNLIDKSKNGWGLVWPNKRIKPKVGNIIGLQQQKLAIGFIRWLSQSEETDIILGVELVGINAQAIKISNPGFPDTEIDAIYLPREESSQQAESVLLLNNGFSPDEYIFIKKEHKSSRYRQMKQLHSTAFLNRYQIVEAH
ncbi:conserved hypothetical protein [Crenothrix polyspora]|uniref:GTPase-translation elongation factor n=2 Tax=Crenothrix polyspora TaxID=360316 RepID=A0A1R4H9E7_9GAMM|nr:conserved hypothetical protein [Crenothrix polyspora]